MFPLWPVWSTLSRSTLNESVSVSPSSSVKSLGSAFSESKVSAEALWGVGAVPLNTGALLVLLTVAGWSVKPATGLSAWSRRSICALS